jgi:tetratricopeptide (TPR) repeat protein
MKDGAMGFEKVALTTAAIQLPPWATAGMTIGRDIAEPRPAAIATVGIRTEMLGGVDVAPAATCRDDTRRAAAAWALHAEGKVDEALAMMRAAAELEESTEKHNITPGPIALARELLGDMLLELRQPAQARHEYETALGAAPNRFKAIHGAAKAAELAGDRETAGRYYGKLVDLAVQGERARPALQEARAFLGSK